MKVESVARLRILLLEDNPADAALVLHELRRAGVDADVDRVMRREEFEARLEPCPDAILSDYRLPAWSGAEALRLVRARGLEVPFILVSGSIGEDLAVEAMRLGADDYLLKDRLSRLGAALTQALERRRLRAEALEAARALREREAGLRQAERIAGLAHAVTRPDGSFESWSETLPALIAMEPPQVPKSTREWLTNLHSDDRQMFRSKSIAAAQDRTRVDFEYRLRRGDGEWIELRHAMEPLQGETEAPGGLRWFNTIQDVTDQRRAQRSLAESEARFRQLAENIREVFWLSDPAMNEVLYVSPAYAHIWGRDPEALYASPRNWRDAIHPDDRDRVLAAVRTRQPSGEYDEQYRIVRPDGTPRWIRDRAFPVLNERREVVRIAGIAEDITDRRRAEQIRSLEHAVARSLADAPSAAAGLHSVMRLTCESEGWEFGRFWQVDEAARVLRFADAWSAPGADSGGITEGSREVVFAPGVGLAGRVWQSGQPLWVNDVRGDARVLRTDLGRVAGMRGAFVFPVASEGKVLGALAFSSREIREPDERLLAAVRVIGSQVGQFLQRKRSDEALRESEQRFSDMLGGIRLVSLMLDCDARILYCNDYLLELTGWRREQVLGKDWFELFIPPEGAGIRDLFAKQLAGQSSTWHRENEILTKSGERRLIRWNNTLLRSIAGETIGAASIGEDITERKLAEARIERFNRIYAMLSGINALIARAPTRDELYREACRIAVTAGKFRAAWLGVVDRDANTVRPVAWHGLDDGYVRAMPVSQVVTLDGAAERSGLAPLTIMTQEPSVSNDMTVDPRILLKEEALARGFRSLAMLPLIVSGRADGVLALYAAETGFFDDEEMKLLAELAGDISFALDNIAKKEQLDYLAFFDSHTGLANRALFLDRLGQSIRAEGQTGGKFALAMLDIERFTTINESLGRQTGDALLKLVAARLGAAGGRAGAGRIGADVFALMLGPVKGRSEAGRFMRKALQACFSEPFRASGMDLRLSAKAGVVLYPGDGGDAETLLRRAEAALRSAKKLGERQVFYTPGLDDRSAERLTIENRLRQALDNEEFVLHYQPKVDLETRRITGVEALIRWQSPELGLVPPGKFIPLMEETGLILAVGTWALRQAALVHRRWTEQKLKPPRVAVNVSPIQLRQRDFVAAVEQAIIEGVAPTGIDLEITENLMMDDVEGNIEKLKALRKLGVQIAIDDFGTGHSSLGYLAKLPANALKIDRSFIITMLDDPDAMLLVQTIISLAHSLRLKVIAEGVDSEDQAKILRLLYCDEVQGHLFSRSVPFEEMTALLRSMA